VIGPDTFPHSRPRLFRLLVRAVNEERGISLILALLTLIILGTLGSSVAIYTTGHLHASYRDQSSSNAYQLAEAGLNDALSVISAAADSTPPTINSLASIAATKINYPQYNGSVTYSGTSSYANNVISWTITSAGVAGSGTQIRKRTLQKSVTVRGINVGADGSSWSRFYQDAVTPCLTIENEVFVTNVATKGSLCIVGTGGIIGAGTTVDVGGTVTITGPVATGSVHSPSAATGWTNPSNVYSSNSVYATTVINAASNSVNQDTTGFNLGLPATAKILGIAVSVQKMAGACCNAVQTITTSGTPTGGSFKISATPPGGSATTSVAIAYNASYTTVQAALVTIFGSGNVVCSGGNLPTAVVCTFQGSDANKAVTLMSQYSNSLTGGSSPKSVYTNTTTGGTISALQDVTVQLLKAGSPVGSNYFSGTAWSTSKTTVGYGSSADLWGTTWTPADLNASTFGVRFAAKNVVTGVAAVTASLDYISVTVTYNDDTNGIGTASQSVAAANINGACTYNGYGPACNATDHVYATAISNASPEGVLQMPQVDFSYWWAHAMPGPKHFCTNPSPGLLTSFFDNDAAIAGTAPNQYTTGNTTGPNRSITINGEMAPAGSSYTCQVWSGGGTSGTLLGELSWNNTTHVLKIKGTVFVDGNFRFDEDGEVVNYSGRGTLMSSADDEIDAVVCAGWPNQTTSPAPTTDATSCLTHMSTWDSSQNMMVLMSEKPNEYDQGSSGCSGNTPPTCYNNHLPGGFQGIMYSTSSCEIHQNFQDSGPVICNTINLPDENSINPTFYTFPSTGNLTDGQKYADTATASHFEVDGGPQTG
jgi:Tfp pilus assembly protein PilX